MDINIEMIAAMMEMDPAAVEAAAAGIVTLYVIAAVAIAFTVIRYLMVSIGYCTMYRKAGVAPWKAFIPVYNTYNNYKLSWNAKMFFLYAVLTIVTPVLGFFTEGVMGLVSVAASIALICVMAKQCMNMAKLFGKGTGTGIALMFFPGITSLILGLGKAEYQAVAE